MAIQTDQHNFGMTLAVIEADVASISRRMGDQAEREAERHAALVDRLDERHESLLAILGIQSEHRDASIREFVRASIETADARLETRLDALEADQAALRTAGKLLMWGGGALGTVAAGLAWAWEHLGPAVPVVAMGLWQ